MTQTRSELDRLRELLEQWNREYDPEMRMIRKPFSSPGYHTTLKGVEFTHPTRDSLVYALALLDSEIPEYEARAGEVIGKVLTLQDRDRSRPTYGIWPWFYEEPLEQMSPPDWNWADFCGKTLVLIARRHLHRLDPVLAERIRQSIFAACDAIIKRDVGPGYTNIAIMGAFVTLIAGEQYDHEPYRLYGLERLRKFHAFTKALGTFQEYNSPNYTPVAIIELSGIHSETRDTEALSLTEELLDIAWKMAAEHFHPATGQWGGPHSRSYRTMLNDYTLSFLDDALGGGTGLIEEERKVYSFEHYRKGIRCPDKYRRLFIEPSARSIHVKISDGGGVSPDVWAYHAADERYSLGTFDREVMWNQRRNWLAYARTSGGNAAIALRFLHDGYDYSSAVFICAQHGWDTVFAIAFCTDGGDTHIGLDPISGSIQASDLRLRFELLGDTGHLKLQASENQATVTDGEVLLQVNCLHASFEGQRPVWEIGSGCGKEGDYRCLDYVVYSGESRPFRFTEIREAVLLFAARLGGLWTEADRLTAAAENGTARAQLETAAAVLSVASPVKPAAKSVLLRESSSSVFIKE